MAAHLRTVFGQTVNQRTVPAVTNVLQEIPGLLGVSSIQVNRREVHEAPAYDHRVKSRPNAKYGGRDTVSMLTGDGVGPELLGHVKEVFRYAGAPIDFEVVEINASTNTPEDMENAYLSVKRNGVALKGPLQTKFDDVTFKSMNVALRRNLNLFASIVKCKSIPGIPTRHDGIDCVLIRENKEGEYKALEHENVPGVVESLKVITRNNSLRIARFAFQYAKDNGRKKVTAIHKANIMKQGDGLFLQCCKDVSAEFPDIEFNDLIIDNASMQMVSRPQQFDVLCMPNLYGNILSNIASGLVGGAGVTGGMNVGPNYAVFESGTRQSGKSMKGKNVANPVGMLMASTEMLDYLGHNRHAEMIRESVMTVVSERSVRTPDVGGSSSTIEVIQAIIDDIKPKTSAWKAMQQHVVL